MRDDFVIDTSVVMSWCFRDEINSYADMILEKLESNTAFAPSIWPLEVANVLLVAERKKRLSEADTVRFLTLLSELPIIVEQEDTERMVHEIVALARKHHLSSYDASYLHLAMRKGIPLATLDKNLIAAAIQSRTSVAFTDENPENLGT
jgi:predicted nucleic acid-binding protein